MSKVKNISWALIALAYLSSCNDSKPNLSQTASAADPGSKSTPHNPSPSRTNDHAGHNDNPSTPSNSHAPSTVKKPTQKRDPLPLTCPNPDSSILPMKVIPQKEEFWCWAACGQMVMRISQCIQANTQLNMDTCCRQPRRTCDRGSRLKPGLYRFDADSTADEALSWEEIKNQIDCKHKPFSAFWRYTIDGCGGTNIDSDTSGHLIVISGYRIDNGEKLVKVLDPSPPGIGATYTLRYSEFICGEGYAHWKDYYNIKKRQP